MGIHVTLRVWQIPTNDLSIYMNELQCVCVYIYIYIIKTNKHISAAAAPPPPWLGPQCGDRSPRLLHVLKIPFGGHQLLDTCATEPYLQPDRYHQLPKGLLTPAMLLPAANKPIHQTHIRIIIYNGYDLVFYLFT